MLGELPKKKRRKTERDRKRRISFRHPRSVLTGPIVCHIVSSPVARSALTSSHPWEIRIDSDCLYRSRG